MKIVFVSVMLLFAFVGTFNAQSKSMTGKVTNFDSGASGRFGIITVIVGGKEYFAYTESANGEKSYNPKVTGDVTTVGKTVRIYYSRFVRENNDLRIIATRIVEFKQPKK